GGVPSRRTAMAFGTATRPIASGSILSTAASGASAASSAAAERLAESSRYQPEPPSGWSRMPSAAAEILARSALDGTFLNLIRIRLATTGRPPIISWRMAASSARDCALRLLAKNASARRRGEERRGEERRGPSDSHFDLALSPKRQNGGVHSRRQSTRAAGGCQTPRADGAAIAC